MRPRTPSSRSQEFVEYVRQMVDYWDALERDGYHDCYQKLTGLAFSILAALDGVAEVNPPVEERSEMLHEMFYGEGSWRGRPVERGGRIVEAGGQG